MKVVESELIALCDVDNTLIKRVGYSDLQLDYYGQLYYAVPLDKNIEFVKSLKARGYYIVLQSNNGWRWAKQVVEKLGIDHLFDECKSKPSKVVDDEPAVNWIPYTINLDK
jgi:phosphoglycolate phosphatase-like HAD superfamily hydrolase